MKNKADIKGMIAPVCKRLHIDPDHVLWSWQAIDELSKKAMEEKIDPIAFAFATTYMNVAGALIDDDFLNHMLTVMQQAKELALKVLKHAGAN